jgi:hypothetical protein
MKKGLALICLALFLTGCSAESELELGMAFRDSLLSGNGCCFEASITADYGDELYEFTMDCQGDAQGNVEFCVTSPETISGITGNISEAGGAEPCLIYSCQTVSPEDFRAGETYLSLMWRNAEALKKGLN